MAQLSVEILPKKNSKARPTYIPHCGISLLKCTQMTSIGLLTTQNTVAAVHPSQASMSSQVSALALEASYSCVCDDSVKLC
jgi:hypothetical protein